MAGGVVARGECMPRSGERCRLCTGWYPGPRTGWKSNPGGYSRLGGGIEMGGLTRVAVGARLVAGWGFPRALGHGRN